MQKKFDSDNIIVPYFMTKNNHSQINLRYFYVNVIFKKMPGIVKKIKLFIFICFIEYISI